MKIVLTHTGYSIDKSPIDMTLAIEAPSVESVAQQFQAAAMAAFLAANESFFFFNEHFYSHNVMPLIRPQAIKQLRRRKPDTAMPTLYEGRAGSHYFKAPKIRTLDDWFAAQIEGRAQAALSDSLVESEDLV